MTLKRFDPLCQRFLVRQPISCSSLCSLSLASKSNIMCIYVQLLHESAAGSAGGLYETLTCR